MVIMTITAAHLMLNGFVFHATQQNTRINRRRNIGHWYDKDGNPRHHEGKNGKDTTLREARKLSLYPSVTTVGQVVAKFQLTNWLQEEAAMVAADMVLDNDELSCWNPDRAWAKTVVKASREKTMQKADAGTDIHGILEEWFGGLGGSGDLKHLAMCEAVEDLIHENTGFEGHCWRVESRFCDTEHGYAGMCDLHNDEWIIDFKTKDTVDAKTRGWPEQAEQLAAYAHGLGYPNARLANVFISRENPTDVKFFEHSDPWAWERFKAALNLWQVTKKYGPLFDKLKERSAE